MNLKAPIDPRILERVSAGAKFYAQWKATADFKYEAAGDGTQKRIVTNVVKTGKEPIATVVLMPDIAEWQNQQTPGSGHFFEEITDPANDQVKLYEVAAQQLKDIQSHYNK